MSDGVRYPIVKNSDFKFSRRIGETTFCRAVGLPVPAGYWRGFQGVLERVHCFRDRDGRSCFAWSGYDDRADRALASLLRWIAPVATRMSFERYTGTVGRPDSENVCLGRANRGPSIHRTHVVVGRCVAKVVCDDPTKHLSPETMGRIAKYAGFNPHDALVHPDSVNERRLVNRAWSRFPVVTREQCVRHVYGLLHLLPVDADEFDVQYRGWVQYPYNKRWTGPWVFGSSDTGHFWGCVVLPLALKDRLLHPASPFDWAEIRRFHRWLLRSWRELVKNRDIPRRHVEVPYEEKRRRNEEIVRDFDRKRARVNAFVQ